MAVFLTAFSSAPNFLYSCNNSCTFGASEGKRIERVALGRIDRDAHATGFRVDAKRRLEQVIHVLGDFRV